MNTPQPVVATLELLRAERSVLQARLDAIDLASMNLQLVWPLGIVSDETVAAPRRKKAKRRVLKKSKPVFTFKAMNAREAVDTSDAATRRNTLLDLIAKAEAGMTIAELRQRTPKMDVKDRSNALSILKAKGAIKRAGNTWIKAA